MKNYLSFIYSKIVKKYKKNKKKNRGNLGKFPLVCRNKLKVQNISQ